MPWKGRRRGGTSRANVFEGSNITPGGLPLCNLVGWVSGWVPFQKGSPDSKTPGSQSIPLTKNNTENNNKSHGKQQKKTKKNNTKNNTERTHSVADPTPGRDLMSQGTRCPQPRKANDLQDGYTSHGKRVARGQGGPSVLWWGERGVTKGSGGQEGRALQGASQAGGWGGRTRLRWRVGGGLPWFVENLRTNLQ